jgi:hypothetical protein
MKKYLSLLLIATTVWLTQSCGSSDSTPSPNDLIKGKWIETKTSSTGRVTRGLPLSLQILFPGGVLPAQVLDTVKIIRELNFLNATEVDITTTAATNAITKANWKFTNGTSKIEFTNVSLGSGILGSVNAINADVKELTAQKLSLAANLKLTNVEIDARALNAGLLRLDIDLSTVIDMKK